MPIPMLSAYIDQLPRLRAEESLVAAERIAVGTGSLKKGHGKQIAAQWQRTAGQTRQVLRPSSKEAYRAQMAMAGIGIRPVKRDG